MASGLPMSTATATPTPTPAPPGSRARPRPEGDELSAEMRFAHLSDWHATSLVGGGRALLQPKRLSGWASWALRRRRDHSPEILAATLRDVRSQDLDPILVTGDLTHVSLEQEFRAAAEQLERLGPPDRVFLIPGNHDCYVPVEPERSWDHWRPYLAGDAEASLDPELADCLAPARDSGVAPRHEDYPTLRIRGRLAMVGLCSAIPTPIFRAGGELGEIQRERLERVLRLLGDRGLFRVIMIHHPIARSGEPTRRALWDAEALRALLARTGAELVLHGHKHRRRVSTLPGPDAPVPVVGVPSSSEVGSRPGKLAQYHVYTLRPREAGGGAPRGFELEAEIRGYDPEAGEFRRVDETLL